MEVKLIHVLNRDTGPGHTSQSEAALGHTLDTFNLSLALLLGQRTQHTGKQTYITSGSSSAPSLHGFFPFLTFYCGQSPYATIAWRIPLDHNNVLLQHGQSRPATKHNILCCSASISCALIHLNTASGRLQQNLNMAQNISIQLQCFSMQLQYSVPTS